MTVYQMARTHGKRSYQGRLTPEKKADIVRMHGEGKSYHEISDAIGSSYTTIEQYVGHLIMNKPELSNQNIKARKKKSRISFDTKNKIIADVRSGKPTRAIADSHNLDTSTIYGWMRIDNEKNKDWKQTKKPSRVIENKYTHKHAEPLKTIELIEVGLIRRFWRWLY